MITQSCSTRWLGCHRAGAKKKQNVFLINFFSPTFQDVRRPRGAPVRGNSRLLPAVPVPVLALGWPPLHRGPGPGHSAAHPRGRQRRVHRDAARSAGPVPQVLFAVERGWEVLLVFFSVQGLGSRDRRLKQTISINKQRAASRFYYVAAAATGYNTEESIIFLKPFQDARILLFTQIKHKNTHTHTDIQIQI